MQNSRLVSIIIRKYTNAHRLSTVPLQSHEIKLNEGLLTPINCLAKKQVPTRMGHIGIKSTTVDPEEVRNHEAQKNDWWNPRGPMKGLHSMNKVRVPLIREGLIAAQSVKSENINTSTPLKGLNIVDIGCGGGILSEALARLGAKVVGLDASDQLISVAKTHSCQDETLKNNVEYIATTIEAHAADNEGIYDAVVASEVIEHVSNQELFLKSCVDVLKPGGSIFITTLNKTKASWILGIIVAENVLNILPRGTHDWEKFISPGDLSRLLHDCGCTTKLVHGFGYLFVNNTWYFISNMSINYAIHAVKA